MSGRSAFRATTKQLVGIHIWLTACAKIAAKSSHVNLLATLHWQ